METVMGRWGDYKNQAPKGGGDGKYVNLKDGDSIRFSLTDSEPGQEVQYWLDKKSVPEGTKGAEMSTKIMLCVFDVDTKKMRIIRLTPNTFVRLCEKAEKFKEDDGPNVYELERKLVKGKVQYEIDRLDRMTPEQRTARDREDVYDVFNEKGVEALPEQAAAPLQQTSQRTSGVDPLPSGSQAPDDDVPF
jgi:hypothetical protein